MRGRGFDPDLTRPAHNGVYFVGGNDLQRLARTAAQNELCACRIDLIGCHVLPQLLQRLAVALRLPASFGHDWDGLADGLRDLRWLHGWGHVLLIEHADTLQQTASANFDILLGVLDDAATFASDQDKPWFAFLALADSGDDSPAAR